MSADLRASAGQGLQSVLGYHGRPARIALAVTINDRPLYRFDADLASGHFAGGQLAPARHLRRQAMRILTDSHFNAVERLGVKALANGRFLAGRQVHVYPRMTPAQREDLVAGLCHWFEQWLLAGALPIGEAQPLWQREGRVIA